MRLLTLLLTLPLALLAQDGLVNGHPADIRTLRIGDKAPDFTLPGIDGKEHSLSKYAGGKALVVLFTSNHCPTSHSIERRLQRFWEEYRPKGVRLVAINPNHPDGLSRDELGYGEYGDSFEEMKPYAERNGWTFDYLYDGERQSTARAYGCLATPHVFVFDADLRLRYKGRFDDSGQFDDATVKSHDVRNAVDAILAGQPVKVEETRPMGCSTKWREKKTRAAAVHAAWAKAPVTVETLDAAGVAKLRANGSGNIRILNVWATWCAPCVQEFPDLVDLSRQFDMRNVELITLSLDKPADLAKAQAFLQRQAAGPSSRQNSRTKNDGRTTNHYLFTGTPDELAAALDKEMAGPIPHTLVIDAQGKVLFRHTGIIDREKVATAILDRINRFYGPAPQR
jgi:peroxiredoxin